MLKRKRMLPLSHPLFEQLQRFNMKHTQFNH